jgi:hypothetical protein
VNGVCGCGLPAHCCQPAVAGGVIYADLWGELNTHLAPQALFTQSSPVHKPLLQAFPFPSTLGEVVLLLLSHACVFVYSSCGKWVFPPLLWRFPPCATLTSFPTPGCWAHAPASARASPPTWLVYLQSQEGFPSPNLQCSVCPTLYPACLYCSYCLLLSFSFFPRWRSVCPRGYAALAQGCLWEYHSTTKLTLSASSQAICAPATGGPGALLVSPFNVNWRFSAPVGGVEGSKFCLFSGVLPARCVSSVSPRFHYWRQAFCFLPLPTILESIFFFVLFFRLGPVFLFRLILDHHTLIGASCVAWIQAYINMPSLFVEAYMQHE